MRLWTWQSSEFSIIDSNQKVESLKHSIYVNNSAPCEKKHFESIYEKLFNKLKTDQFHWYFSDEQNAKSEASIEGFAKNGKILWEVEVPEKKIFKFVCSAAWNWLIGRKAIPEVFRDKWSHEGMKEASRLQEKIKGYKEAFRGYWDNKTESNLWDLLFIDNFVEGCTQVLVKHPLEGDWVIHNPL